MVSKRNVCKVRGLVSSIPMNPQKRKEDARRFAKKETLARPSPTFFPLPQIFLFFFCLKEKQRQKRHKRGRRGNKPKKNSIIKRRVHVYPPLVSYPPPSYKKKGGVCNLFRFHAFLTRLTFIETFNRHRRVLRTRRARIVRSKTQRHDAMMSFARAPQHASVFFTGTKMNASRRHSSETSSTSSSSSSSSSNRRAMRHNTIVRAEGDGDSKPSETPIALAGTPVRKTSMLVIGATGTLGRQVVRRALDEGYDVRCLVRPRQNPADFLRDWGATTVSADLTKPETLPPAFVGKHTIVDASTARPEEDSYAIDWEAKKNTIQIAAAMGIQKYVFYSIDKCEKYREVPLMNMKYAVEEYLKASGMNFCVLRLCGFMQPLIAGYAVPVLEEQPLWGTDDDTKTAYLDTQDVAQMTMAAVRREEANGKILTLAGPKAYSVNQVIELCEKLGGNEAKVSKVPVLLLKFTRALTRFFQWSTAASDRLAFAEVLSSGVEFNSDKMAETYKILGMDESETTTLEEYMEEYFSKILKKLKEVGGESRQRDFYL